MTTFLVDDTCTQCGLCVTDCPVRIIDQEEGQKPVIADENKENCIGCQHCLAVCPVGAFSINGYNPSDSLPIDEQSLPTAESMERLVRSRRSIRHYKEENVSRELIDRLLHATANCPTGINFQGLTFSVVDDSRVLYAVRDSLMKDLAEYAAKQELPAAVAYLERTIGPWEKHGADIIFRGAPHLLIVSTPPGTPCPAEDVVIALSYFELLARTHGVGTTWCGMVKMAMELLPQYKDRLKLPGKVANYYPMLFGYPSINYARTVQRDNAAVITRVE